MQQMVIIAAVYGGCCRRHQQHFLQSPNLVDSSLRYCIQKESQEAEEAEEEEYLQDFPFPVFPEYVFEGLQRVHKPEEGGVRSAVWAEEKADIGHWLVYIGNKYIIT